MKPLGPFRLSRRSFQLSYDIHSWIGVIGGLVLFICCFSGSLALFESDLSVWEQPATRLEPRGQMLDLDTLLIEARQHLEHADHGMFVELPAPDHPALQARVFHDGEVQRVLLDPYSGERLAVEAGSAFTFLTHLHTDLHLPRPFGRYLVGFLGIVLMMSLISGAMAHPKVFKELFLMRWRPSLRLNSSDLHKQLGVWGLVFGGVMAFTGAIIGLLGLFAPVMVLSAFGGDVEKATEAFSGPHWEETGVEAPMLSVQELMQQTQAEHPELALQSLFISHWKDETAEVSFNLERDPYDKLAFGETHRVSLVTGETLHVSSLTGRGAGARLFAAMQPVHYGLFGGLGLKLIYFVSGIALSLGIVTGSLIWLAKRRRESKVAERRGTYYWLGRVTLGVCLGQVIASTLAIGAGRFLPGHVETVFWVSWLACLAAAFLPVRPFVLVQMGGFLTAALLIGIAFGDLFTSTRLTPTAMQMDLVLLSLGTICGLLSWFGPILANPIRRQEAPVVGDVQQSPA